eukprot:gene22183-27142_t
MAALCAFASGCSTLTGEGTGQNLSIMTYTTDNKDLTGAQCELKNDEGTWTAVTPATVMVRRSNKDLMVKCTKSGAIIDHNNGSAYEYPSVLKLIMGQDSNIKEGSQAGIKAGCKRNARTSIEFLGVCSSSFFRLGLSQYAHHRRQVMAFKDFEWPN